MRFTDAEISSTGAFLVGELERLDQELYAPLADFTWSRDIDLREDVTIADEVTSFMLANYAGGFGSVSYTHLDVYKRQPSLNPHGRF